MDSGHCSLEMCGKQCPQTKSGSTFIKDSGGGGVGVIFPGGPVVKPHTSSTGSMGSILVK